MATFKGAVKQCVVCDSAFKVPACRAETAICCSRKCKDVWWRTQRDKTISLVCQGCGTAFTEYASHAERRTFCSISCKAIHQVNRDIDGEKNPQWKGGKSIHADGYIYKRAKNHPFLSTGSYIFQHRAVMEDWLRKNDPNSRFLIEVDGIKYLDPKIVVHHRNEIKSDNNIANLECMTQKEHMAHHRSTPQYIEKVIATLQKSLIKMKQ